MAQQNIKVHSSNRIAIVIDGKQVGALQSVRASDDYGPEPASGIGDIHVFEHVPSMARHSLSVSSMVLRRGSLRSLGIAMENGDDVLRGLVFDIEAYDKLSNELVYKYTGCSYASGDVEINKHSIVMASGMFNAIDRVGTGA